MSKPNCTPEQVREHLQYYADTGTFVWRTKSSSRARAGSIAGTTNGNGYRQIGIGGRIYPAHRLAWCWTYGKWPIYDIDHINGVKDDNRLANLREATRSENMQNQRRAQSSNKSSGILGVHKTAKQKWLAHIKLNKKLHYLGSFDTAEAACAAYTAAKQALHPFAPAI
jgi:hypothetical protein